MSEYAKHKLSLKKKLLSKCRLKDPLLSSTVANDSMPVAEDLSPAKPALQDTSPASLDPPVTDADVSDLSGVRSEIFTQVQSLFASFAKSLEGRFSAIDERFSQVMSNTKVTDDSINSGVPRHSVISN